MASSISLSSGMVLEEGFAEKIKNAIIDPVPYAILHAIGGLARSCIGIASQFVRDISKSTQRWIAGTQFTTVALVPFMLMDFIEHIKTVASDAFNFHGIAVIIGDVAEVLDGISNIAEAIGNVGATALENVAFAGPLQLVSAAISSIFFYIHSNSIYHSVKALQELDRPDFLKEAGSSSELSQAVGKEELEKIKKGLNESNLLQMHQALRTRIKWNIAGSALGILITAIGITATAILLATTAASWSIAGMALVGALYTFAIIKTGIGFNAEQQFKQVLNS